MTDAAPPASPASRFAVAAMTPFSRYALMGIAVIVVLLLLGPLWLGRAEIRLLTEICTFLVLAQMWNLLAGYSGLVSVGQQAFVGLGAYTFFFFTAFRDSHPLLAIVLAGVFAALLAIPTAAVVFRLQGAYFAIGTWVAAEVYRLSFAQISAFGGGSGLSLPTSVPRQLGGRIDLPLVDPFFLREAMIFWFALLLAVGSVALVYALLRSRFGLALAAIRDSEPAAESVGVNTAQTKYIVYIAAAFVTGACGAIICLSKGRVSPDSMFSVMDWTAYIIFIVVIGGVGRIEGPIVGTIIFFILRGLLADLGTVYLIILGALAVAIMLVAPRGLWGLVVDRFGIEVFPVQRRLVVKPTDDERSP
jgi:branched-chain amino acid transport system permease protein